MLMLQLSATMSMMLGGGVTLADTDIANQNPLRNRGYYYDSETM